MRRCGRDNAPVTRTNRWPAVLAGACVAACAPAHDWREFVPEGSGLHVAFPCRPDRTTRTVVVAGRQVAMSMLSCRSDDVTYAVGFLSLGDPQRITSALSELRANAVNNVRGGPVESVPLQIEGMTANAQASRVTLAGRLPDGTVVQEHAAFFTRGLQVYQAVVIGATPGKSEIGTFFDALKFPA